MLGPPKRDAEPGMHASYVLLSNLHPEKTGGPNIPVQRRRFPRTRSRPQSVIDAEAAAAASATAQAVAQLQMMAAAAASVAASAPPINLAGGSLAFF